MVGFIMFHSSRVYHDPFGPDQCCVATVKKMHQGTESEALGSAMEESRPCSEGFLRFYVASWHVSWCTKRPNLQVRPGR